MLTDTTTKTAPELKLESDSQSRPIEILIRFHKGSDQEKGFWVAIESSYLYSAGDLFDLLDMIRSEWRHERHRAYS